MRSVPKFSEARVFKGISQTFGLLNMMDLTSLTGRTGGQHIRLAEATLGS